ncbi:MAG: M20/M25/M40 family metallo-hydrolase [Elusimicrobiota bacterium]
MRKPLFALACCTLLVSQAFAAAGGSTLGGFSFDSKPFFAKGAAEAPKLSENEPAARFDGFAGDAVELFFPGLTKGQVPGVLQGKGGSAKAVPSDGEMQEDVRLSPLTNPEREAALIELFRRAGASDIQTPSIGLGSQRNIVVKKKGRTDRIIVVGGHHDKVSRGQGVIDNWTGATMVVNLYKALKDADTEHTFIFITFGGEESGLVGSEHFVSGLSSAEKGRVDGMLNFDTLAVDGTYSWKNGSDRSMLDLAKASAQSGNYDLKEINLYGGSADSASFREAGMPAITIFGASPDIIFDIIHSGNDNFAAFSLPHYKNAFSLGFAMARSLDAKVPAAAG